MKFVMTGAARTAAGMASAAKLIGCDEAALKAVLAVETAGIGYDKKSRLKALFEPHIFYRLLKAKDRVALSHAEKQGLAYPKWGMKPYPADSYARIEAAMKIDPELALQATSWGLGQILGVNHKAAGYSSARVMVEAFMPGEDEQIAGMARFIVASGLAPALRRHDWAAFARGYNGPAYAKNAYHTRLARAYAMFSGSPAEVGFLAWAEPDSVVEMTPARRNAAIGAMHMSGRNMMAGAAGAAFAAGLGAACALILGVAPIPVSIAGLTAAGMTAVLAEAALRRDRIAHEFLEETVS
jgi:hypothetical protein